jgi:hypothetical protein
MLILKKSRKTILLYSLLGLVILGNLACFSEVSNKSSSQETTSEMNNESESLTLSEVIGGTVGFFAGLLIRSDDSTEKAQSSNFSQ